MSERRTALREKAVCPLDVLDEKGRLVGCMADVSAGGLRVTHIADPGAVQLGHLTLELPRWLGLDRSMDFPGRFVWFREGPNGMEAGFAFEPLSRRKEAALEVLVSKLGEMWHEVGGRAAGAVVGDQMF